MDKFGLQLLKARLCLLMFGEITDEAGKIRHTAGLHFTDRKMHRESGSVLALASHDTANADDMSLACGVIPRQIAVVARTVWIRHQNADVLADRLLFRVPELPLRCAAEELHDPVAVDDDHGIGDGLQDRLQMTLARS